MPKRLTTKEFIERAKSVHGDIYDYEEVNYITSQIKIKILCKLHGLFEQTPNNHLRGQNCPECGELIRANNRTKSTKTFIKESKEIHGTMYSYDLVKYTGQTNNVKIICPKHGVFEQLPYNHLYGKGCHKCGVKIATETISSGKWRHIKWIKNAKRSPLFDSYKLYIIKCWDDDETFYKIGRTFLTIDKRFISCSIPYEYELISLITHNDGLEICKYEMMLHNKNKEHKYIPKKRFKGIQECFSNVNEIII